MSEGPMPISGWTMDCFGPTDDGCLNVRWTT